MSRIAFLNNWVFSFKLLTRKRFAFDLSVWAAIKVYCVIRLPIAVKALIEK